MKFINKRVEWFIFIKSSLSTTILLILSLGQFLNPEEIVGS